VGIAGQRAVNPRAGRGTTRRVALQSVLLGEDGERRRSAPVRVLTSPGDSDKTKRRRSANGGIAGRRRGGDFHFLRVKRHGNQCRGRDDHRRAPHNAFSFFGLCRVAKTICRQRAAVMRTRAMAQGLQRRRLMIADGMLILVAKRQLHRSSSRRTTCQRYRS